jgi:DNA-binding NtrC family response regulator
MAREIDLLVVASRLDNRKALLRVLDGLPVNVFTAATVEQAHEVLACHDVLLAFCEENFPDGTYRTLLSSIRSCHMNTRLVLMLCTGEWDEYLEAIRLGAADVIRCPLQPTDVELALIRAAREHEAATQAPALRNLPGPVPLQPVIAQPPVKSAVAATASNFRSEVA